MSFLEGDAACSRKQPSLKKRIAKEWKETDEGKRFIALLGADTVNQCMLVKELMFEYAHEKL